MTIKLHRKIASLALLVLAAPGVAALQAQVNTGFESANGYTANATAIGVDDSGIPGTATWTTLSYGATLTTSSANPKSGSLALRIGRTSESPAQSASGSVNLADAGVSFTTTPIEFSFSLAISEYSAGTGSQFQLYLGAAAAGAASNKYWTSLVFNDGNLLLYKSNGEGDGNTPIYLGDPLTYANVNDYIDFKITFDPVAKTYLGLTVSGSKKSTDFSSSVAGSILPWLWGNSSADPAMNLSFFIGSNDIITVDIDDLRIANISNIPEPATHALWLVSTLAAFIVWRRAGRSLR